MAGFPDMVGHLRSQRLHIRTQRRDFHMRRADPVDPGTRVDQVTPLCHLVRSNKRTSVSTTSGFPEESIINLGNLIPRRVS